jgi:hypothetical protein
MAKFHGLIGFVEYAETSPDVYTEVAVERSYSGDILRKNNRFVSSQQSVNDNLVINNQISIIADPFINSHFPSIRYVVWKDAKWKVTSVDDSNPPKIILTLGEIYNGPETGSE